MSNKLIANLLIASFTLAVFAIIIEEGTLELIAGLGMWVFGIWSIVRLYKLPDIKK